MASSEELVALYIYVYVYKWLPIKAFAYSVCGLQWHSIHKVRNMGCIKQFWAKGSNPWQILPNMDY